IELVTLFSVHDFERAKLFPPPPPPPGDPFEVMWKFRGEHPNYYHIVPKSAPVLDEARVYFGTDDGTFYALEQRDGSVAWTHKVTYGAHGKFIFSSPAVHDGVVFFGAYDGNVYALHTGDG